VAIRRTKHLCLRISFRDKERRVLEITVLSFPLYRVQLPARLFIFNPNVSFRTVKTNSIRNTWYLPWQFLIFFYKKRENLNRENRPKVGQNDWHVDIMRHCYRSFDLRCNDSVFTVVCQVLFILGINWQCLVTVFGENKINFPKAWRACSAQSQVMVEEQASLCVLTSPQVGHYRYFMSRGAEDPRLDMKQQRTNERTEAMKSRISEKFEKRKRKN